MNQNQSSVMDLIERKAGASKNPDAFVPAPSSKPELFISLDGKTKGYITMGTVSYNWKGQKYRELVPIFAAPKQACLLVSPKKTFYLN